MIAGKAGGFMTQQDGQIRTDTLVEDVRRLPTDPCLIHGEGQLAWACNVLCLFGWMGACFGYVSLWVCLSVSLLV